jgi:hypothetical protein
MTNTETTNSYTFRLQSSIVEELRKVAEEQGKTLDQYANLAVAEKLAAVRDFAYLPIVLDHGECSKGTDGLTRNNIQIQAKRMRSYFRLHPRDQP